MRFAWRPVAALTAAAGLLLVSVLGRYGYHRDELYFMAAGRHLAWGYDDQPPLTPFLVRVETAVFGTSVSAVRVIPLVLALALIPITARLAREFGGDRRAQVVAAAAMASSTLVMLAGHLFGTASIGLFFFAVIALLAARWIRTGDDRLLPLIGLVTGIALLNNDLILGQTGVLLLGVAIAGPRRMLTRPWLWAAVVLAVLIWSPYLMWQARHGWPELDMVSAISKRPNRPKVLPFQILAVSFATPVWVAGLIRLFRDRALRPFRAFAWGFVILLVLILLTGGQPYYPSALLIPLFAAGGQVRFPTVPLTIALAVSAAVSALIALPVLPVRTFAHSRLPKINDLTGETVGWPRLVHTVEAVRAGHPHAIIFTANYGEAGALQHAGVPDVYSGHNGYIRWGPPRTTGPVITVGYRPVDLRGFWSSVTLAARIDNGVGLADKEQGQDVLVCAGQRQPWTRIWPVLAHHG